MKKKLFAALSAALLLGSTAVSPVSAAETYKKGDVNMDGEITVADAQLVLIESVSHICAGRDPEFTQEQEELAGVLEQTYPFPFSFRESTPYSLADAQCILLFCVAKISGYNLEPEDFYRDVKEKRKG